MLYSTIAVIFVNHDSTKIEVDNPLVLNLSLLLGFTFLTLITLRNKNEDKPLSVLQTNQIKGLAIILIILYHLSIHTIKKRGDLPLFEDAGFVGVALFLILSGLGLSISLEKKGIQDFFSKRLARVYIPVFFAMTLEVLLNHVLLHRQNNIFFDFGRIFINLGKLDRNMWFIVFIIFWYCIIYLGFRLKFSKKALIIFLFSVPMIFLYIPHVPIFWRINAFSFPVGCLLGINSKFIEKKIGTLLERNIVIIFGIVLSLFVLANTTYYIAHKSFEHARIGTALVFIIVAVVCLIYILQTKMEFKKTIETICLISAITIGYFNCFNSFADYSIAETFFMSLSAVLSAAAISLLVSLLVKFNLYSLFLSFIGGISFELYLLHGMFMYSFDFILFRGSIAFTFFIYFLVICLASIVFKQLNSIVYDSLLKKLNA